MGIVSFESRGKSPPTTTQVFSILNYRFIERKREKERKYTTGNHLATNYLLLVWGFKKLLHVKRIVGRHTGSLPREISTADSKETNFINKSEKPNCRKCSTRSTSPSRHTPPKWRASLVIHIPRDHVYVSWSRRAIASAEERSRSFSSPILIASAML